VNGAAFAACDERVDFFAAAAGWFDGVNDGESTLNVFLEKSAWGDEDLF
jgi:hypothetical protein